LAVSVFGLVGDCDWCVGGGYDEIMSVLTSD